MESKTWQMTHWWHIDDTLREIHDAFMMHPWHIVDVFTFVCLQNNDDQRCCCVDAKTGVKKTYYRCRRNKRPSNVGSGKRRSKSKTIINKGHVGCQCVARHMMQENTDGSVLVVFRGLHNHDCQEQYLLQHLNPLDICPTLSDIVDMKLLAGVTDLTNIHHAILKVCVCVCVCDHN